MLKQLINSILFFAILELSARCDDMVTFGADFFKPYTRNTTIEQYDSFGLTGKPGGAYQKWKLNNLGFRGNNVNRGKNTGVLRILCAGASETFGLYEDEGKEWPAQLSRLLKQNFSNTELINTSFYGTGYFYSTIIHRFEQDWIKLNPDILILYASFYSYLYRYDKKQQHGRHDNTLPLIGHVRILGKIQNRFAQVAPKQLMDIFDKQKLKQEIKGNRKADPRTLLPIEEAKQNLENDIKELNAFCKKNGIILILSSYVQRLDETGLLYIQAGHPQLDQNHIIAYHHAFNEHIKMLAQKEQILFANIADEVNSSPRYLADGVHFTNEGALSLAEQFYKAASTACEQKMQTGN